uniref:Uncharacterized protein n=1 Tax=Bos indicus x Bos taurus TaxID=30522 RepID=A0A4W2EQG8_BOBOX
VIYNTFIFASGTRLLVKPSK